MATAAHSGLATEIAEEVRRLFGIDSWVVMFDGGKRDGNIVMARSFFWYVMHLRWKYSTPELESLTMFDNSSIRIGILRIAEALKTDRDLQQKAKALGV